MTALTAPFAGRTVFRVGYGALQLERLHHSRGEAVALLRRAVELGVDRLPVVNLGRLDSGPGLRPDGDQLVDLDDQLEVMTAPARRGQDRRDRSELRHSRRSAPRPAGGHRLGTVLPARRVLPGPAQGDRRASGARRGRIPGRRTLPGRPRLATAPRAPDVLLIPGTANPAHLKADTAAGGITLDAATLATLDAIESRSAEVPVG